MTSMCWSQTLENKYNDDYNYDTNSTHDQSQLQVQMPTITHEPIDTQSTSSSEPELRRSSRLQLPENIHYYNENQMGYLVTDNYKRNVGFENDERTSSIPNTYEQAMRSSESEKWQNAIDEEMNSLMNNKTWTYEQLPKGKRAIGCKWVFDHKRDENGKIIRYKARLVAKGFLQQAGIDFNDTFAPVLRNKSLKVMLALVTIFDLELVQMDVVTAFLNADIKEQLFMKQPQGYHKGGTNIVCRLLKSVYGTRQASHNWNELVNEFLISIGFKRCISDTCVYVRRTKTGRIIVIGLYVDDLPIGYHKDDEAEWEEIKTQFMNRFKMKYLGECRLILGMRITRNRKERTLTIDSEVHINRMLTHFQDVRLSGKTNTSNK